MSPLMRPLDEATGFLIDLYGIIYVGKSTHPEDKPTMD